MIYLSRNNNNTGYSYDLKNKKTKVLEFHGFSLFVCGGKLYHTAYPDNNGEVYQYDLTDKTSEEDFVATRIPGQLYPNSNGVVYAPFDTNLIRWVDYNGMIKKEFKTPGRPGIVASDDSSICYTVAGILHIIDLNTDQSTETSLDHVTMIWTVADNVVYLSQDNFAGISAYNIATEETTSIFVGDVKSFQICEDWQFIYTAKAPQDDKEIIIQRMKQ